MFRSGPRLAALAFLLVLPSSARAQHMYLDTNGDGVHTDADVLQPSGPTALDLWIRTDANRDGSPATCSTGDGELTISGYEFILHASNGTMSWGSVENRVASFASPIAPASNATELHAGALGSSLAPGAYRLATIQASPATGTPRLDFAPNTPLDTSFYTFFSSQCSGQAFDNTLALGVDWFDVDGVAYGGIANAVPTIDPIPALTVDEASTLDQNLTAHDADGNPLQFTKSAGPGFLSVTTIDPGAGTASGLARLTPGYTDAGTTTASVDVTDGIGTARAEFTVTVQNSDRAPSMEQPVDMLANAGGESSQDLHASDPDGGILTFLLVSGPEFTSVATLEPLSPALGRVTFRPGVWDGGTYEVTVAASDGLLQAERTFFVTLFSPFTGASTLLCRPYDMTVVAGTVAEQTVMLTDMTGDLFTFYVAHGPSWVSIAPTDQTTSPRTAVVRVSPPPADLGTHTAIIGATSGSKTAQEGFRIRVVTSETAGTPQPDRFTSAFRSYDVCDIPQGVVLADLNKDGLMDVITPNYGCGISVLLGIGGGQFPDRREVALNGTPKAATVADLDGDGDLDVLVANGLGNQIEILAGDGTGSFARVAALPAGPDAAYACAADMNGDGVLDVVGADEARNTISVYLGSGGMSYGPRQTYPAGLTPCFTAVADFNGDGVLDVAAANEGSNALSIHMGLGNGVLAPLKLVPTANGPSSIVLGDFDEDGITDLGASGFHTDALTVLFGDGHGEFPRRVDPPTGQSPWSVFAFDLNGDHHMDLVSANTGDASVGVVLGNGDGTFRSLAVYPAGLVPRFAAAGDVNGDGRAEIVVAHELGGTIAVMAGPGDGTFGTAESFAPGMTATALEVGDVTGDGTADVVLGLTDPGDIHVYPGLGDGRFGLPIRLASGFESYSIRLGDVNGDGVLDLLSTLEDAPTGALYLGGSTLGQAAPLPLPGGQSHLEVGDWNKDGALDLAMTSLDAPILAILDGDGAGGFANRRDVPLPAQGSRLTSGDWDGDGVLDLAMGTDRAAVVVAWGDGAGFVAGPTLPTFRGVTGLTSGDLDGDGRAELVVSEPGSNGGIGEFQKYAHGELVIFRWSSRATEPVRVYYPAGSAPISPRVADVTGDGRVDLLVCAYGAGAVGVLPGLADGTFGARQDHGVTSLPLASAVADVDGDGRPDIVTGGPMGDLSLLRNLGSGAPPPLAARGFVTREDQTLRLRSGKPTLCVHLEPVGASFLLADVDPSSIRMSRTDSATEPIGAIPPKAWTASDVDHNGIQDAEACFARDDLRRLFADLRGTGNIPVRVTGSLAGGRVFDAELALLVVSGPAGPPLVQVSPNPFNPRGELSFTLEHPGRARLTLHDVRGRLVARLYESKAAPAGPYRIPVGRGGAKGADLASGIYFFRLETDEGVRAGRFTVLK